MSETYNNNGVDSTDIANTAKAINKMVQSAQTHYDNAQNREDFKYRHNSFVNTQNESLHQDYHSRHGHHLPNTSSSKDTFVVEKVNELKNDYTRSHGAPLINPTKGPTNEAVTQAVQGQKDGNNVTISQDKVYNRRTKGNSAFISESVKDGFIDEVQSSDAAQGKHQVDKTTKFARYATSTLYGAATLSEVRVELTDRKFLRAKTDKEHEELLSKATNGKYLTKQDARRSKYTNEEIIFLRKEAIKDYGDKIGINFDTLSQSELNIHLRSLEKRATKAGDLETAAIAREMITLKKLDEQNSKARQNVGKGKLLLSETANELIGQSDAMQGYNTMKSGLQVSKAALKVGKGAVGAAATGTVGAVRIVSKGVDKGVTFTINAKKNSYQKKIANSSNPLDLTKNNQKLQKWTQFSDRYSKTATFVKSKNESLKNVQAKSRNFKSQAKSQRGLKKVAFYTKSTVNGVIGAAKWSVNNRAAMFIRKSPFGQAVGKKWSVVSAPVKNAAKWVANSPAGKFVERRKVKRAAKKEKKKLFREKRRELYNKTIGRAIQVITKPFNVIGLAFAAIKKYVLIGCSGYLLTFIAITMVPVMVTAIIPSSLIVYADGLENPAQRVMNNLWNKMEDYQLLILSGAENNPFTPEDELPKIRKVNVLDETAEKRIVEKPDEETVSIKGLSNIYATATYTDTFYVTKYINKKTTVTHEANTPVTETKQVWVPAETKQVWVSAETKQVWVEPVKEWVPPVKFLGIVIKEGYWKIIKEGYWKTEQVKDGYYETVTVKEGYWKEETVTTTTKETWTEVIEENTQETIPVTRTVKGQTNIDGKNWLGHTIITEADGILNDSTAGIEQDSISFVMEFVGKDGTNYTAKEFFTQILSCMTVATNNSTEFEFINDYACNLFDAAINATNGCDVEIRFKDSDTGVTKWKDYKNEVVVNTKTEGNTTITEKTVYSNAECSDTQIVAEAKITVYLTAGMTDLFKIDKATNESLHKKAKNLDFINSQPPQTPVATITSSGRGENSYRIQNPEVKGYYKWLGWYKTEEKTVENENFNANLARGYAENEDVWDLFGLYYPGNTVQQLSQSDINEIIAQVREYSRHGENSELTPQREKLIRTALENVGRFYYSYGGGHSTLTDDNPPAGMDCSGFMNYILWQGGVDAKHVANRDCVAISKAYSSSSFTGSLDKLIPGDMLIKQATASDRNSSGNVNHITMYIGKFKFGTETPTHYFVECTASGWGDDYACTGSMIYPGEDRDHYPIRIMPLP